MSESSKHRNMCFCANRSFCFPWVNPWSRNARLCGRCMFDFLRSCQAAFYGSSTVPHPRRQRAWAPGLRLLVSSWRAWALGLRLRVSSCCGRPAASAVLIGVQQHHGAFGSHLPNDVEHRLPCIFAIPVLSFVKCLNLSPIQEIGIFSYYWVL